MADSRVHESAHLLGDDIYPRYATASPRKISTLMFVLAVHGSSILIQHFPYYTQFHQSDQEKSLRKIPGPHSEPEQSTIFQFFSGYLLTAFICLRETYWPV